MPVEVDANHLLGKYERGFLHDVEVVTEVVTLSLASIDRKSEYPIALTRNEKVTLF